jgi:hypothetical protein
VAVGYKDFTAGAALAAADLEDYCELQSTMRFASAAARTTALSGVLIEGLRSYTLDTNCEAVYSGSAWSTIGPVHGALTSWTPAIVQSGAVTCTVTNARYQRVGRWVSGWFDLAVTGAGSAANAVTISLPVTAAVASTIPWGVVTLIDSSAGLNYNAFLCTASTTTFDLRLTSQDIADPRLGVSQFTAALAAADAIKGTFAYEAAADA